MKHSTPAITASEARAAILAIVASLPDSELPKGRIEKRDDSTILWFGGRGSNLGTARSNGELDPQVHRSSGVLTLLEEEATYRADLKFNAKTVKA